MFAAAVLSLAAIRSVSPTLSSVPAPAPDPTSRDRIWTDYWRHGRLHSLSGSFSGNYEGNIRRFWVDAFSGIAPPQHALDIGTGNGPLPALLCEIAGDAMPHVDAIDIADINPAWLDSASASCRQAIRFHSRTSAEELPFPDGRFSLAVSQYGLEYCRLDAAVNELARVLAPDGKLALILHHRSSRLAQVAAEEVRLVQWLLGPDGLLPAARAIYPYMHMVASGQRAELQSDAVAGAARDRFNAAQRELSLLAGQSTIPDALEDGREFVASQVSTILQRTRTAEAVAQEHAEHEHALQGAIFRNEELLAHALDETGMATLVDQFERAGFHDIQSAPLHHESHLIGWSVNAVRA